MDPPIPISHQLSNTQTAAARRGRPSKRGHGEHKSKGLAQPLNETVGAGRRGCVSAHLCGSGLRGRLFIISRQHTRAWNIAPPSHRVLPAGKKQGAWRCGRNANERPPPHPSPLPEIGFSPGKLRRRSLGSKANVNSSPRLFAATAPHVPTINQHL